MNRMLKLVLAYFRLSKSAVCEMSVGRGMFDDFHDYHDSDMGPVHFHIHTCARCSKRFCI